MVVKCEQVWREISNYLEGHVDASLRSAMDEHFHSCAKCQSILEGMRNVIRLYGDERMIEVPPVSDGGWNEGWCKVRGFAAVDGPRGQLGWSRLPLWF